MSASVLGVEDGGATRTLTWPVGIQKLKKAFAKVNAELKEERKQAAIEVAKTKVGSKENCPGRHGLARFITNHASYCCNTCRCYLPQGAPMWGCRICDWDVCEGRCHPATMSLQDFKAKKESGLPRGVKREHFDKGGAKVKAARAKDEPGQAKYRIKCKQASVKREVKSKRDEEDALDDLELAKQFQALLGEAGATTASSCAVTAVGDVGDSSASRPSSGKVRVVHAKAKQSGVRNIVWHTVGNAWLVKWSEDGKQMFKYMPVRKYMEMGSRTYDEADAEALRDAIVFRESLVAAGKLKPLQASYKHDEECVIWLAEQKAWDVQLQVRGRLIDGGRFRSASGSPAAVEEARLAAVARLQELRTTYGLRGDAAEAGACRPRAGREFGAPGVRWEDRRGRWHVYIVDGGKKVNRYFRPRGASPEAVEAARVLAVRCRQELEREIGMQRVATEAVDPRQIVNRESGVRGVSWEANACQWLAKFKVDGKQVHRRFRPVDISPEAIEAARLLAVQCNEELRRQKSGLPLSAAGS